MPTALIARPTSSHAARTYMCFVLRVEEFQRGRRDHATALNTGRPVDGLPHRRTGYVLDHEARLVGAVRAEGFCRCHVRRGSPSRTRRVLDMEGNLLDKVFAA